MADTLRTFIAFKLPEKIVVAIGNVQERLKPYGFGVRWVKPENIHLTLKFLGNTQKSDTETIGEAIYESAKSFVPISLTAKGIGAFPGIQRPRVIWVGISGQLTTLQELQTALDEKLEFMGFPREKRPFKGHLTLGRVKGRIEPKRFHAALRDAGAFEPESFVVDTLVLYQSELKPTGAVYTSLYGITLV